MPTYSELFRIWPLILALVLVGLLVGVVCSSRRPAWITLISLVAVLAAASVVLVMFGVPAAAEPRSAPVLFLIGAYSACPAVVAAVVAAFAARYLSASRMIVVTAAVAASIISGPIVIVVTLGSICAVVGDCL